MKCKVKTEPRRDRHLCLSALKCTDKPTKGHLCEAEALTEPTGETVVPYDTSIRFVVGAGLKCLPVSFYAICGRAQRPDPTRCCVLYKSPR